MSVYRGIVGQVKARLRIDRAPLPLIMDRQRVCSVCPRLAGNRCSLCRCPIPKKTLVASERCPEGRW